MTAVDLLLVGFGKMGGAMLAGWRAAGTVRRVVIVDPAAPTASAPEGAVLVADPAAIPADFTPAAVVLAVKPQMMDQALPAYAAYAGGAVFLSIAAGKTIAYFQKALGAGAAVVRAMPNTPAAVGRGISGAYATPAVSAGQRDLCQRLLSAVGEVVWVGDEGLIDAVTAVSGSGPAYVFHLVEAMAAAGAAVGLPPDLALRLARATVTGAGELLYRNPETTATQLRINVTSPKGTTQAALDVLMDEREGLTPLMTRTVAAANRRSRELAG
ncbi:pyrroline-5-carboxylate reductase [Nitrospirillum sp. BR 11163]|uniref:pyrroline-5-carboxylate reductase n=1 Tax=Nitrospirillum sp. BR 11163 TaxID=3104323 RepID=UPI002AFF1D92|nr:pyrroline-5-carboxylate reductase [Nitrospirillum sp. BR 11163]MEA1675625.1 pyrroline-5-carboxylate reductase [Nitrospirillum sp. BR 11163]